MNILLWILQILLGLLFIVSGGIKLVVSIETMNKMGGPDDIHLPGLFIRFIGVCEVLGGLGLILPWALRIRQSLTPMAALGLTIIMIGAVVTVIMGPGIRAAIFPFIVGVLTAFIAYSRWREAPHR